MSNNRLVLTETQQDLTTTKEFKLNKTISNMEITDSLDVEVSASYNFSSSAGISLSVYYD